MTSEFPITTHHVISMKDSQHHNERWLHSLLKDEPSLLGLGDLNAIDSERRQPSGGRLDLLLSNRDTRTRYEVEIQLGATDETHIIRTIEYWDIERKRYPQLDHIAVIVAEQVTSRFLNVIQLFNGAIPLIAIQIQLVEVKGNHSLIASRIVDLIRRGTEEEDAGPPADRASWEKKTPETLRVVDDMIDHANELVGSPGNLYQANYTQFYIGIMQNGVVKNFMQFWPYKKHVTTAFKVNLTAQNKNDLRDAGLDLMPDDNWIGSRIRLAPGDREKYGEHIDDLIRRAHAEYHQP